LPHAYGFSRDSWPKMDTVDVIQPFSQPFSQPSRCRPVGINVFQPKVGFRQPSTGTGSQHDYGKCSPNLRVLIASPETFPKRPAPPPPRCLAVTVRQLSLSNMEVCRAVQRSESTPVIIGRRLCMALYAAVRLTPQVAPRGAVRLSRPGRGERASAICAASKHTQAVQ
jgi:hypothetical protein